jgi:hypothetical protein
MNNLSMSNIDPHYRVNRHFELGKSNLWCSQGMRGTFPQLKTQYTSRMVYALCRYLNDQEGALKSDVKDRRHMQ